MSSALPEAWPRGDSYSQWLRGSIARVRQSPRPMHRLFDSSTAEPTALLAGLTEKAFSSPITSRYQGVFAGGNPYVVDALAERYHVDRDSILCTAGATSALTLIYRAFLNPGDRVLVEAPGFDLFDDLAAAQHIAIDRFQRDPRTGAIDVEKLAARLRPATRLIVLSNLHNPTGAAIDDATMRRIAGVAEERGIHVVVDEVYHEYAHAPETSAIHLSPAIVTINSLTKVYGLSALRCGWIVAHHSSIDLLRAVHTRLEFGVSKVAHALAALVLEEPEPFEHHWRSLLAVARPEIDRRMAAWQDEGLIRVEMPPHGCVCFPELVGVGDTRRFADWLADRYGVLVAPGTYFGAPGHVRIGFSSDIESLNGALDIFGEALAAYRERPALVATA